MPNGIIDTVKTLFWGTLCAYDLWPPKCDLDLEVSLPKHGSCTSSQCGEHLSKVSSKPFAGLMSYRTETK